MTAEEKFKGKVALVTGAGIGIGRAIAIAFAKQGAQVVVNDINEETAIATAKEIKDKGGSALAVKADVARSNEVNAMVDRAMGEFAKIDILVNNAGGSARERATPFHLSTEEVWDFVIGRNFKGVLICTRAVINQMMERRYGKIIIIGSAAALTGEEDVADYVACKAGVLGFTRTLAREVGPYNINVVTVSPGTTETVVLQKFPREKMDQKRKEVLLTRIGQPEDIANLVLFLASDEASYITGHDYVIDGGGFL